MVGMQSGRMVRGLAGLDQVPAIGPDEGQVRLTAGEYVQPVKAVIAKARQMLGKKAAGMSDEALHEIGIALLDAETEQATGKMPMPGGQPMPPLPEQEDEEVKGFAMGGAPLNTNRSWIPRSERRANEDAMVRDMHASELARLDQMDGLAFQDPPIESLGSESSTSNQPATNETLQEWKARWDETMAQFQPKSTTSSATGLGSVAQTAPGIFEQTTSPLGMEMPRMARGFAQGGRVSYGPWTPVDDIESKNMERKKSRLEGLSPIEISRMQNRQRMQAVDDGTQGPTAVQAMKEIDGKTSVPQQNRQTWHVPPGYQGTVDAFNSAMDAYDKAPTIGTKINRAVTGGFKTAGAAIGDSWNQVNRAVVEPAARVGKEIVTGLPQAPSSDASSVQKPTPTAVRGLRPLGLQGPTAGQMQEFAQDATAQGLGDNVQAIGASKDSQGKPTTIYRNTMTNPADQAEFGKAILSDSMRGATKSGLNADIKKYGQGAAEPGKPLGWVGSSQMPTTPEARQALTDALVLASSTGRTNQRAATVSRAGLDAMRQYMDPRASLATAPDEMRDAFGTPRRGETYTQMQERINAPAQGALEHQRALELEAVKGLSKRSGKDDGQSDEYSVLKDLMAESGAKPSAEHLGAALNLSNVLTRMGINKQQAAVTSAALTQQFLPDQTQIEKAMAKLDNPTPEKQAAVRKALIEDGWRKLFETHPELASYQQ